MKSVLTFFLLWSGLVALSSTLVHAHDASITLAANQKVFRPGEDIAVEVLLSTGDHETAGTDLLVSYDPTVLVVSGITEGSLYSRYTGKEIDNDAGTLAISGVVEPGTHYKGSGVFATILFKAKAGGKASIAVQHELNNRNDSNVASIDGEDVLDSVESTSVEVQKVGWWARFIGIVKGIFRAKR